MYFGNVARNIRNRGKWAWAGCGKGRFEREIQLIYKAFSAGFGGGEAAGRGPFLRSG